MYSTTRTRYSTFFSWNLIMDFTSTEATMFSRWEGNLPALLRSGPRKHGICLTRDSEVKKASYFLASFLTNFLFLLSFFSPSISMWGNIHCLGFITELGVPRTQRTWGQGVYWNLMAVQKCLWVIVLQADLQSHHFQKLVALALVTVQDFQHRLVQDVMRDLATHGCSNHKNWERTFHIFIWCPGENLVN